VRLLGFPFPHADPDAFAVRGENPDFISAYGVSAHGDFIPLRIRCGDGRAEHAGPTAVRAVRLLHDKAIARRRLNV
jgi:hypothetical protein